MSSVDSKSLREARHTTCITQKVKCVSECVCACLYVQCGYVVMLTIIFNYHFGLSIRFTDLGDVLVSAVVETVH